MKLWPFFTLIKFDALVKEMYPEIEEANRK